MQISISQVHKATGDVRELLEELNRSLAGNYADDQQHGLAITDLFRPNVRFFVARTEGLAAGCGGGALCDGYAEVKRFYVRPAVRRRGVAGALLQRIEAEAHAAGLSLLRLETGVHQHEALAFYERAGFTRRGPFGPYLGMPPRAIELSLFYEKAL